MGLTIWTYCPKCMTRQEHNYVPGVGWICINCMFPNKLLNTKILISKKEQKNNG